MKKWNIDFIGNRKVFFILSGVLLAVMLVCTVVFGVNLDIQFKGGALLTYSYTGELEQAAFQKTAEEVLGQSVSAQESVDIATGTRNIVLSLPSSEGIDAALQAKLAETLTATYVDNQIETVSISVVNPTIGGEFLAKCMVAICFAAVLMVLYVSVRFRKIGGWAAGVTAVIALIHDLLMVFAVFAIGRIALNANFIAVCLTILGYSLNDTIVIYDRVRENRRIYGASGMPAEELMNMSLNQSLTRSMYTSITTITSMVVVSVIALIFNVSSILSFSFPMIIGMISGCYSSLCIAPALWVIWQKKKAA